jgi:hypothetical protein
MRVVLLVALSAAACQNAKGTDGSPAPGSTAAPVTAPVASGPAALAPPAASAAPAPSRIVGGTDYAVPVKGKAFALAVQKDRVTFCDGRGPRALDLTTGADIAGDPKCPPPDEGNTACEDLGIDVIVRTPDRGPNDIVGVDALQVPLEGRVHDCVADGKVLAVVTPSQVVTIDTLHGKSGVVSNVGGERIAIGPGWIAWADYEKVHAKKR